MGNWDSGVLYGDAFVSARRIRRRTHRVHRGLALFRQLGDAAGLGGSLVALGRLACVDGEYSRARALVEEGLEIRRRPEFDNPRWVARALITLGEIDRCEGDPARGSRWFEQALATGRELSDDMIVGSSLHNWLITRCTPATSHLPPQSFARVS